MYRRKEKRYESFKRTEKVCGRGTSADGEQGEDGQRCGASVRSVAGGDDDREETGRDPELASMAAMLHDMHAYKTGSYEDHAHKGAELAREILTELGLTSSEETDVICSAIYHHDDKLVVDGPMDEVLKGRRCDPSLHE